MPAFICTTCGTHYPITDLPPDGCTLCQDPRFGVNPAGQAWTTLPEMRQSHFTIFRRLEPGLMGVGVQPHFGFGQRALLLRTAHGNILWDCPAFLDDATTTIVNALGGVAAIALSNPIGYGAMVDWSHAFGGVPIYIHAADRKFVPRLDSAVVFWEDNAVEVLAGITLIRCGGQFDGASVLHWAPGASGQGVLMVGDTLRIHPDRQVGFMRSHANGIPQDTETVIRIGELMADLPFEVMYGGTWDRVVQHNARSVVARSVRRHVDAVGMPTML